MKVCPKCGATFLDTEHYCAKCGTPLDNFAPKGDTYQGTYTSTKETTPTGDGQLHLNQSDQETLHLLIKVLMIIMTIFMGFGIIPLFWCIPMLIIASDRAKNNQPYGIALGILTIIFVSRLAGILMLISDSQRPTNN